MIAKWNHENMWRALYPKWRIAYFVQFQCLWFAIRWQVFNNLCSSKCQWSPRYHLYQLKAPIFQKNVITSGSQFIKITYYCKLFKLSTHHFIITLRSFQFAFFLNHNGYCLFFWNVIVSLLVLSTSSDHTQIRGWRPWLVETPPVTFKLSTKGPWHLTKVNIPTLYSEQSTKQTSRTEFLSPLLILFTACSILMSVTLARLLYLSSRISIP